jgi:hypothetical protein
LTVQSPVEGARVLLRSQALGTTPLGPLRVNAGHGSLEVLAEGYYPFQKEVDLPPGGIVTIEAALASKSDSGVMRFESPLVGVAVTLDGKAAGEAPVEVALKAGSHALVMSKAGYEPVKTAVIVAAGDKRSLSFKLEKQAPVTSKWWFWTVAGAVVLGGVATTYALLTERSPDRGTYPPGQVAGPLVIGR